MLAMSTTLVLTKDRSMSRVSGMPTIKLVSLPKLHPPPQFTNARLLHKYMCKSLGRAHIKCNTTMCNIILLQFENEKKNNKWLPLRGTMYKEGCTILCFHDHLFCQTIISKWHLRGSQSMWEGVGLVYIDECMVSNYQHAILMMVSNILSVCH